MDNDILKTINEATDLIWEAKELLKSQTRYSHTDKYIEILDNALNDLSVVSGGIQIEEKLIANPELADKILEP